MTQGETLSKLGEAKRIPELDGLRGIAIGLVIVQHYFSGPMSLGSSTVLRVLSRATSLCWSGVDLFFVLSGFLIGGILLDARHSPNYFKVFYVRRICRIFPIYFAVCGIAFFLQRTLLETDASRFGWLFVSKAPWYSYLLFMQNVWMAVKNEWGIGLLAITWSLAVEEQFYLTLPALIRFVRSSALPYVLGAGIILAPMIRTLLLLLHPENRMGLYVLLPCRMDSLLLGVLAAWAMRKPEVCEFLVRRRKLLWVALGILGAGVLCFIPQPGIFWIPMVTLGYDLLALFYLNVLILILVDSSSWLAKMMRWRWLRGLGAISYGTYLLHVIVYTFCMEYLRGERSTLRQWGDLTVTLIALGLTIALAQLSWRFFEKPIVRWGHAAQYEAE
jgi:peptidoglycan/LPS O-acetylase OafA/YrhL